MDMQVLTYVKIYQIAPYTYVQFIECQLHFNKAVENTKGHLASKISK